MKISIIIHGFNFTDMTIMPKGSKRLAKYAEPCPSPWILLPELPDHAGGELGIDEVITTKIDVKA